MANADLLEGSDRGFTFNEADFRQVQRLIYEHAGIKLSDAKQDMVYSRMIRRLRHNGLTTFKSYLELIQKDKQEWEAFVNSLTTNLTSYFREPYHFPILQQFLQERAGRRMRIWCSAASTGEEPYSIAITVIEALGARATDVDIIATDIDTSVLAKASSGVYSSDRIESLTDAQKQYFFRGTGKNTGMVKVKPEVQRLVKFQQLNLLDKAWPVNGCFDIMFCRNVLIYFDKDTQRNILNRFHPMLADDGLLFVGHSESLLHMNDKFRLRGKTVYDKR
jgi:chemotaxis protein methyltransferase CheR